MLAMSCQLNLGYWRKDQDANLKIAATMKTDKLMFWPRLTEGVASEN